MSTRTQHFTERQAARIEKFLLQRRDRWVAAWDIAEALILDFPEVKEALDLLQKRGIIAYDAKGNVRIRPDASRPNPIDSSLD